MDLQGAGSRTPNPSSQRSPPPRPSPHQLVYLDGVAINPTPALHRTFRSHSTNLLPSSKSPSLCRPGSQGELARHHSAGQIRQTMTVSPEEYDALPPSIQKKCFSTVERLRIAQQSAAQKRRKQPKTTDAIVEPSWLSPTPSMDICDRARPKSDYGVRSSSFSRQGDATSTRRESNVDGFLALPDKVKRSFAVEEISRLTESAEPSPRPAPVVSTTGDVFHQRSTAGRNSSVTSSDRLSSRSVDTREDIEKDSIDLDTQSSNSLDYNRSAEPEMYKSYAKKRQDSINSVYSALPPFPLQSSPAQSSARSSISRHRTLLLAPLPLPPPRLTPAVPPLPSPATLKTFETKSLRPVDIPPSTLMSNPATKYYKDVQARQKLRDYFSSPEKFDEAVEFGFPSERVSGWRSESLSSSNDPGLHTEPDSISNANSKDDDASSVLSPRTPSILTDSYTEPVSQHPSVDSGVALPAAALKANIRSTTPEIDGRQMTLRMTLTRPDLRAHEKELVSWQRQAVSGVEVESCDPLALQPLHFTDDHSGMQGAFAVSPKANEKSFKKMWQTLRGRRPT